MTPANPLKAAALTFDDGPVEPYTSQILDILRQQQVKATFFVIGNNAERNPKTLLRIVQEGHIVGNHSQSHNPWLVYVPPLFTRDILRCQQTIRGITGLSPNLFRPPRGIGYYITRFISGRKLVPVSWTVSSQDWRESRAEAIARRVVKTIKPGAIVLLHDGYAPARLRSVAATIQSLPAIIKALKEENYTFVTVPELLGIPPYH
jgi:peptidoglycan/xylan/chitin deacetylase (PgdA/CDA1 family)